MEVFGNFCESTSHLLRLALRYSEATNKPPIATGMRMVVRLMIAVTPGGRLPSGWAGRIASLSLILGSGRVIAAGVVERDGSKGLLYVCVGSGLFMHFWS